MAILINTQVEDWMTAEQFRDELAPLLPDVSIHCGDPDGHGKDIRMLAIDGLSPGLLRRLPNLELIQKLGAGVDSIVKDPDLDKSVRVCRLKPDIPAHEIAEYCLAYVLREQRQHRQFREQQKNSQWMPIAPLKSSESTVAVLGLGHIGSKAAAYFRALGFNVIGWSRTLKNIQNIQCKAGADALYDVLAEADYVVAILPSTPQTRNLINSETLSLMQSNAVIINAGRGDLINEDHLLDAVDNGVIRGAYLDVFQAEPLPEGHPFWLHPKITITPHVSGWHLDGSAEVVARNYRALETNASLLNEVDIALGY